MAINKNRLIKWFGGLALAALAPLAMANLVLNGGFEAPVSDTSWTFMLNAEVTGNTTHMGNGSLQFVTDEGAAGSAIQSVSLVKTGTYLFDFFLRGNINALTIEFGGKSVLLGGVFDPQFDPQFDPVLLAKKDTAGGLTEWLMYSGVITNSTGGTLLFSFNDSSGTPADAFIDDVSIECDGNCDPVNPNPMPEPGSLLLVGVALTGLALVRRRKQI